MVHEREPIVRDGPFRTAPLAALVAFIALTLVAAFLLAPQVRLPDFERPAPRADRPAPSAPATDDVIARETAGERDCGGKPCP